MKPTPFIEFSERIDREGVAVLVLVCPQLPPGFWCSIKKDGRRFQRKTRANGNGSIRYHQHDTTEDACAAATRWARRKLREASK